MSQITQEELDQARMALRAHNDRIQSRSRRETPAEAKRAARYARYNASEKGQARSARYEAGYKGRDRVQRYRVTLWGSMALWRSYMNSRRAALAARAEALEGQEFGS